MNKQNYWDEKIREMNDNELMTLHDLIHRLINTRNPRCREVSEEELWDGINKDYFKKNK